MTNTGILVFLYAETPLHAGSGGDLGAVDLPLQRERMSHLPVVQGSGLKGAWREELDAWAEGQEDPARAGREVLSLFGPRPPDRARGKEEKEAQEFAGALSLTDARLLLLPVRTVWGGWAWLTCPLILERLSRDLTILGQEAPAWSKLGRKQDKALQEHQALVAPGCAVVREGPDKTGKRLLIEDLDYLAKEEALVTELATFLSGNALPKDDSYQPFRERMTGQLAVVSDEEFRFLATHATEVVTRVRIDRKTGTVADGALWTEENLPAESLLWSLGLFEHDRQPPPPPPDKKPGAPEAKADQKGAEPPQEERRPADFLPRARAATRKSFHDVASALRRLRLGGDRTVGRGIVAVQLYPAALPQGVR